MGRRGPVSRGTLPGTAGTGRLIPCVFALVLFAPWCLADDARVPRLLGVEYLGDLPTLVADERGYFRAADAQVRVEYTDSGRRNLERLRAGTAEIALMAKTPLVIDALRDPTPGHANDPVILGNLVHSHRLNELVSLERGPVDEPGDLAGRRLGLMKGTNAEFFWWLFAHVHGLDADRVEVVDRPIAALPGALAAGRVDAAVLWAPWISRAAQAAEGGLRVLPGSGVYTAHWLIVARRAWANEHGARVRALLRGYSRAIDWIDSHRDQALRLYARRMDVARVGVERNRARLDYALNLDWALLNGLRLQLQWARAAGYARANAAAPGVLELVESGPLRRLDDGQRVSIPRPGGREKSP